MEIKTIDIANTTESELLAIIKNNCQVSKNIQSQIDTLSKFKMKPISEQRETRKMEKPQKLVETPMESREDQDDLKSYIATFNVIEEKEEFLQTAKQTMSTIDFTRLISQLQLQTISNLQELKSMEEECETIEDLHELQQEVSTEQSRLELIARTVKQEVPRHTLYKVIGGDPR